MTPTALNSERPRADAPQGLDAVARMLQGRWRRRASVAGALVRRAAGIDALMQTAETLSDQELTERLTDLRVTFRRRRETPRHVDQALALIGVASQRTRGERPFVVQLAGALVLHAGGVAEMATGEGKTLTIALAAVLAGWRGLGVHVVTANDYLAQRDADAIGGLLGVCGLRSAAVRAEMSATERRFAYAADVTYCTSREAAADCLRDQLSDGGDASSLARPSEPVQRPRWHAIVDEADAILIDEAITPLILENGEPQADWSATVALANEAAVGFESGRDYRHDRGADEIALTPGGRARLATVRRSWTPFWSQALRGEELLLQALRARETLHDREDYLVGCDGLVPIEARSGRLAWARHYRDGLQQALESKESLAITGRRQACAQVSFQAFFRGYRHLAGASATAVEVADELWQVYGLAVHRLPTEKRCLRRMDAPRYFRTAAEKWRAIVAEVCACHAAGQPVLIGVRSVVDSEALTAQLCRHDLPAVVLNARHEEREAAIIARAGQAGQVTVATNMAGRGTDIRLGAGVAARGGLRVLVAEHQPSRRSDRQFLGRCARQGDPGSARFFASLEDALATRFVPRLAALLGRMPGAAAGAFRPRVAGALFSIAQNRAERRARQRRLMVLSAEDRLEAALSAT